jgi:hypothetical protein
LTLGLKATSLEGRLLSVMAVIWWQSAAKLGEADRRGHENFWSDS